MTTPQPNIDDAHHGEPEPSPQRDALTLLYDATAFEASVAAAQVGYGTTHVALIELARLARFNDHHDRAAGDRLVVGIARRLDRLARSAFGTAVIVARISGARFAVLPPVGVPLDRLRVEMHGIAGTIGDELTALRGDQPSIRMAVGAVGRNDGAAAGISTIARRLAAPPALVRAIDIESAIAGHGLTIVFQPQYAMDDDRLTGAEALVRWQHPRLGEVGGTLLFAAATAAGVERRLSHTIWQAALAAMAGWPAALQTIRVALNVTPADVANPDMAGELLAMAKAARIDPHRLAIEVTETALIEGIDAAAVTLTRLREAGLRAALDDFGTGYSGLAWLKRLPVDYIKIDSGFARDASGAARDQAVLQGVIDIAHALDLAVLAEGVETIEQRDRLKAMGCRWYQGFLRAPALDSDAFVAFAS